MHLTRWRVFQGYLWGGGWGEELKNEGRPHLLLISDFFESPKMNVDRESLIDFSSFNHQFSSHQIKFQIKQKSATVLNETHTQPVLMSLRPDLTKPNCCCQTRTQPEAEAWFFLISFITDCLYARLMQHISHVIHSFHLATATHDTHGHIELAWSERKREKFLSLNFLIKLDLNRDK